MRIRIRMRSRILVTQGLHFLFFLLGVRSLRFVPRPLHSVAFAVLALVVLVVLLRAFFSEPHHFLSSSLLSLLFLSLICLSCSCSCCSCCCSSLAPFFCCFLTWSECAFVLPSHHHQPLSSSLTPASFGRLFASQYVHSFIPSFIAMMERKWDGTNKDRVATIRSHSFFVSLFPVFLPVFSFVGVPSVSPFRACL